MRLSVIIPTIRRFSPLLQTIEDLLLQSYSDFEVIVIDQNERWPTELSDKKHDFSMNKKIIWMVVQPNGVVAARQLAVEHSSGDVIVFCDDDVRILDKNFLEKHAQNYLDAKIDAVCGREIIAKKFEEGLLLGGSSTVIEASKYPIQIHPIIFPRNSLVRQEVCTFCTCNASVRKSSFLSIGGFDENFIGASYGDDYDFAVRLVQSDKRIVFDPEAWLIHLQVPMGGLRLSDKRQRFSERDKAVSGWIYLLRHAPPKWRKYFFFNWVLRRTLFLKSNVVKFWRIPNCVVGIISAYIYARSAVRLGAKSRFLGS